MTHGVSNGHVTDDVMWPHRCCEAVRSDIVATAWLLVQTGSRNQWHAFHITYIHPKRFMTINQPINQSLMQTQLSERNW